MRSEKVLQVSPGSLAAVAMVECLYLHCNLKMKNALRQMTNDEHRYSSMRATVIGVVEYLIDSEVLGLNMFVVAAVVALPAKSNLFK